MKNTTALSALIAATFPQAFDTGNGWKKDDDGKLVVDASGNPIFIGDGGKEQSVKGDTIATLNAEAKANRIAKETAETNLAKFGNITPETALANATALKDVDLSKMVSADKLDEVRKSVGAEYQAKLDEQTAANEKLHNTNNTMVLDNAFNSSKFIKENIAVPMDMFSAMFKANFKIEDGKPVAYNGAGNKLNSAKNMGELADFDEAVEILVSGYHSKDAILKPDDQRGSGNTGGGGNGGGGKARMSRAAFDALPPGEKAQTAAKVGKGEVTVTD